MPPNEDPKAEQLSQSVNAEIERRVSERLKEIQERLDQRVQETMRDDRQFVKDTIGVAFKIAGFAVAAVVVVLGALGWKTFSDVSKTMTDTAAKKSDEYFSGPDGKRIIDSTLDKAVLDSYLVRIARMNADKASYAWLPIDHEDADRLFRIIKDEKTSVSTFESAAKVLILTFGSPPYRSSPMLPEVGEAFAFFISTKDKDTKWLERNRAKRRSLLQKLSESKIDEDQIKGACRELISSDATSEFKRPAMTYLGTVKDQEAVGKLVELAKAGKDLMPDALIALAKIEPTTEALKNWIADLDKITSNPPVETINTALRISEALQLRSNEALQPLARPGGLPAAFASDQETARQLAEAARQIVEFAAQHSRLSLYVRSIRAGDETTLDYTVNISAIQQDRGASVHAPIRIPSTILFDEQDGWTKIVTNLLEKYAQEPDLKHFRQFVGWLTIKDYFRPSSAVVSTKVVMSGSSVMKLEDGEVVDKQSIHEGVILDPVVESKDGQPAERLMVRWTDSEGGVRSGVLQKFEVEKGKGFLRFKRVMNF